MTAIERRPVSTGARWLRFNLVGLLGFVVQAIALTLLARWTALPVGLAVAIAVLAAVSHNFLWHERFTWRDRLPADRSARGARWLSFNLSNGLVSLIVNVGLTMAIVKATGWPLLAANLVAVLVASLVNFAIGDRLIFRPAPAAAAGRSSSRASCPSSIPESRRCRTLTGAAPRTASSPRETLCGH
jgi:putative flippase GtrA